MSNIKEITHDQAIGQIARKQAEQVKSPAETNRETETTRPDAVGRDLVEVDAQRADEAQLEENARLLLNELPEVRSDRVEEAKRKLAAGFYDSQNVLEETAGKIRQELASPALAPPPKDDPQEIARTRNRLAQGYYDQPQVLDETARKIVKKEL
jgi:anti-sigma28 factor (negative regulator of flagellin synthesis)